MVFFRHGSRSSEVTADLSDDDDVPGLLDFLEGEVIDDSAETVRGPFFVGWWWWW